MVFIQDIVRGTELTIASGGPPGGLPAATADPRQTPSPAARLAQARNKIGAPFWPAAHTEGQQQGLQQDAPRVFLCYKNTYARGTKRI